VRLNSAVFQPILVMSLPNLRLKVLCAHFSACVLKFWLRKTDWKERARLEIVVKVWKLCSLCVSQPLSSSNGQLPWRFEQQGWGAADRVWWVCSDKRLVLCRGSWKWTADWRVIVVSSEPARSNLNYTTEWGWLETGSGNRVLCIPTTCHLLVHIAWTCSEKLSKTAAVIGHLSDTEHNRAAASNLDFSAWSCLCNRALK